MGSMMGVAVRSWAGAAWAAGILEAGVVATAGCATTPVAPDTSGNPEVTSATEADAKLGARVRVSGEAQNAKLSAVVVGEDDWVVYLVEVRHWPSTVEGKHVEATGILGKRDEVVATEDPDGAISQGTAKPVHVLREASYIILDD